MDLIYLPNGSFFKSSCFLNLEVIEKSFCEMLQKEFKDRVRIDLVGCQMHLVEFDSAEEAREFANGVKSELLKEIAL